MRKSAVFASIALMLASCTVSKAALVTTVLTLDAASPSVNTLDLTLFNINPVVQLGTTQTVLSGSIIAEIEINRDSGEITSVNLNGGTILGSTWSMLVPALGTTLTGTGTAGTADTDPDTTSVDINGNFNAAPHRITLTGGEVNPGGTQLAGTDIDGSGLGLITSTLNGDQWDIAFQMAIDDSELLAGSNLVIQGNLVARGSVTAIPEPTSTLALTTFAGCLVFRRRRRK
ncbi:PEP-CTERM sorting domain-containing protein [Stieleria sp. TO1_6]|uniref:PEP-CTERM sorting domain-containing protein n=1 Tax=Stieleria tagensis TaxID=2956795 RepID=UPI00209B8F24|nr:PEP-CTERM sorting domain-containing protein [Stieleria tagensis]MCO8121226.1 PEP-CTERM sorting domain-containing protein [Stieleria tagensis]